ncbi:DNA-binding protein hexbp [Mycena latifolia]|nr:DNA-binding protein hexbp [Mycena latifolia]
MSPRRGCFNCGGCALSSLPSSQLSPLPLFACGLDGHVSRECTGETKPKACYKCGPEGHMSRDCPGSAVTVASSSGGTRSAGKECYTCGKVGHMARACPEADRDCAELQKRACYTYGSEGHISRDCPEAAVV